MTRLSMALKVMPKSYKRHTFILIAIYEITNFMVTISIYQLRSQGIGDTLIEHVFSKYSICEYMNIDQDNMFMSALINYILKILGTKIKTVAPYNHPSLQAEYILKSLATILMNHLTGLAQYWTRKPTICNVQL